MASWEIHSQFWGAFNRNITELHSVFSITMLDCRSVVMVSINKLEPKTMPGLSSKWEPWFFFIGKRNLDLQLAIHILGMWIWIPPKHMDSNTYNIHIYISASYRLYIMMSSRYVHTCILYIYIYKTHHIYTTLLHMWHIRSSSAADLAKPADNQ